jgi:hypothetical protein
MKTETKTQVLIVSKQFLSYHPRARQETKFRDKILNALNCPDCSGKENRISNYIKRHTVRGNRSYWERAIERKMTLSIRQWSGKPRASKQEKIIDLEHGKWGIQPITMIRRKSDGHDFLKAFTFGAKEIDISELAKNDGLSREDFEAWFEPEFKRDYVFEGVIIHFTLFRY